MDRTPELPGKRHFDESEEKFKFKISFNPLALLRAIFGKKKEEEE